MGGLRSTGGRRRKVRKGAGSGLILSKDRARKLSKKAGGGLAKNGWQIQFDVKRDLAYDLDMRKIIEYVSLGLAEFFRSQMLLGQRPDGSGPLPRAKDKDGIYGAGDKLGVRSRYMANHWILNRILGGPFKASRLLKPYGGTGGPTPKFAGPGGRAFIINNLLRRRGRAVDFQSVKGKAKREIAKLFNQAVSQGFGDVTNPARARTQQGLLPELRR